MAPKTSGKKRSSTPGASPKQADSSKASSNLTPRASLPKANSNVTLQASPAQAAGGKAVAGLTPEETKKRENKISKILQRAMWGVIMISGFVGFIYAGHAYLCIFTVLLQFASYYELADVKVAYAEAQVRKKKTDEDASPGRMPFFRTIQCSAFFLAIFDAWGSGIVEFFKQHPNKAGWLYDYLRYHSFFSKGFGAGLFMIMVLSLRTKQVRFQLGQYLWIGLSLAIVVFQLKNAFSLIFSGVFWYVLSLLLVITNDTMAYICGMLTGKRIFGNRVFLEFSPNKTWEGFIGGGIFTVLLSPVLAHYLSSYQWMTCPGQMTMEFHPELTCETPLAFIPGQTILSSFDQLSFIAPAHLHAMALGALASIVAPFGGFLASAIKRAYGIKDFADLIPGHGGVMDRIDCQLLMIFCTSTYLRAFVWEELSVDDVVYLFNLLNSTNKQNALQMMQGVAL
jgi:phosphatidate cytidylyltransferase|mmetsp:Transcript_79488/g.125381  ORF Transcript_79488/g.125381 Transcript_79488/m.125381 type:complete len:453 (+) Transcript_79488:80-1438(+)|eukprot:CAMPEP_0169120064 /NCGR_PEP_ID=MMETSP1015-20121227/31898_1 /TAXON_ID=342587 /ORGANISM="Karlodinium micrum, Strain CCMP2283" /LENGTH=452 /DNA_ID=CAMNT_0009183001 /DNA_START=46 /DNA_END=1404 /DNA_ORIENTATION=-